MRSGTAQPQLHRSVHRRLSCRPPGELHVKGTNTLRHLRPQASGRQGRVEWAMPIACRSCTGAHPRGTGTNHSAHSSSGPAPSIKAKALGAQGRGPELFLALEWRAAAPCLGQQTTAKTPKERHRCPGPRPRPGPEWRADAAGRGQGSDTGPAPGRRLGGRSAGSSPPRLSTTAPLGMGQGRSLPHPGRTRPRLRSPSTPRRTGATGAPPATPAGTT